MREEIGKDKEKGKGNQKRKGKGKGKRKGKKGKGSKAIEGEGDEREGKESSFCSFFNCFFRSLCSFLSKLNLSLPL